MNETLLASTARFGGLQRLRVGPKAGTIIVVVGGVGTIPPEHWTNAKGERWLETLSADQAPDVALLSFTNSLAADGVLSWNHIENAGFALFEELKGIVSDPTCAKAPVVIVTHSLGGFIVKRAFGHARREHSVLRKMAAFVFMGCPHSLTPGLQSSATVETVLQKFTKGKRNLLEPLCLENLATDCHTFQRTVDQNSKLVLTIVEKRGMSKQMFGKKRIFVERDTAIIGHASEIVIEDDSNHRDLCLLSGNPESIDKAFSAIYSALNATRSVIANDSPQPARPSVFDDSTIREQSSDEEDIVIIENKSASGQMSRPPLSVLAVSEPASSNTRESWTKKATTGSDRINADIISALKDFTLEHRDPVLPCKVIPLPRDAVFSGREDMLANIRQALLPLLDKTASDSNSSLEELAPLLNVYSLSGPGGMGKTSIANEFVYRYESEFDAVFWVTADEETKLFASFRDISIKLGIVAETDSRDLPAIRETLLAWLANPLRSYQHMDHVKPEPVSWLLVFDNVGSTKLLEDFWPKDAAGSVLVTCRNPLIKNLLYMRNTGAVIPEMLEEEGMALLLRLTGREHDESDVNLAHQVVQTLGRYPLAISQMAGVILARDLSFREFLEMYSEEVERREILDVSEGQSASLRRYNQTLGTVWALDDMKAGRTLLQVISLLDPDSIPETLLAKNPACADWERYPRNSWEYTQARAELISRSLIYRNRDKQTLRVHRLIQDTVRAQMDEATFNEVYSRVLDMIGARWPKVFKGFGNVQTDWKQNSDLWPHTLSVFKYKDRFDSTTCGFATAIKRMEFTLDVSMFSIADSRFSASQLILSFFTFLRAKVLPEQESKGLDMIDATFHYQRGELGLHINDRQYPVSDFSECVTRLESLLDDDAKRADPFYGAAVNELGCAHLMNWDDEQSLVEFEKSMAIFQNLHNPSAQETTMAQINVGFVHGFLHRYDEAVEIFRDALKARNDELGKDDYSSFVNGKLYMGWGNVLAAKGRLGESFELHIKCLEHYKRSVGNLHHRTGDGCIKTADHFARTGDGPTALALLDQALKIFSLDAYHKPEAARAHFKKGRVMKRMGEEDAAQQELDMALEIYNSVVPANDRADTIDDLDDEDFDHWIMFWSR